ncbi:unnamed protein product [Ilex paraguariensis]|uniref:Uncharacterized protein n=1 Tax=Ilex paraguariensis TaxID=185542 RepID=A0ABC8RSX0_9AQUA
MSFFFPIEREKTTKFPKICLFYLPINATRQTPAPSSSFSSSQSHQSSRQLEDTEVEGIEELLVRNGGAPC